MINLTTRSFLSYADLKKEAMKDQEADAVDDGVLEAEMNLLQFFEEVELVRREIASIRDILVLFESANEESKSSHKQDVSRAVRDRINNYIVEVLKAARRLCQRLQNMERSNAANSRLSGYRESSAVDRIRTTITYWLRKELKELLMYFQGLRQKMMADYREVVERCYFTLTGELKSEDLLKRAVSLSGKGKVNEILSEIQDRHDADEEVEKIHQLLLEMAVIFETQREKMGDIEHHFSSAADYVKGGAKELNHAKIYQRSRRNWFCIAAILLLVLVLLVVIPIAISLSKS